MNLNNLYASLGLCVGLYFGFITRDNHLLSAHRKIDMLEAEFLDNNFRATQSIKQLQSQIINKELRIESLKKEIEAVEIALAEK